MFDDEKFAPPIDAAGNSPAACVAIFFDSSTSLYIFWPFFCGELPYLIPGRTDLERHIKSIVYTLFHAYKSDPDEIGVRAFAVPMQV